MPLPSRPLGTSPKSDDSSALPSAIELPEIDYSSFGAGESIQDSVESSEENLLDSPGTMDDVFNDLLDEDDEIVLTDLSQNPYDSPVSLPEGMPSLPELPFESEPIDSAVGDASGEDLNEWDDEWITELMELDPEEDAGESSPETPTNELKDDWDFEEDNLKPDGLPTAKQLASSEDDNWGFDDESDSLPGVENVEILDDDWAFAEDSSQAEAVQTPKDQNTEADDFSSDEIDWDFEEESPPVAVNDESTDDNWGFEEETKEKNFDELLEGEDEEEEEQIEEEPEDEGKPPVLSKKKRGKQKGKRGLNLKFGKKFFGNVSSFLRSLLRLPLNILNFLASLPILGLILRPLMKMGRKIWAILVPLILIAIAMGIYFLASSSVTVPAIAFGADGAQAALSDISSDGTTASGTVTNLGDVIADASITFTVWSYNPFGGGSLFSFDQVAICEAPVVSVDIDGSAKAEAPCDMNAPGFFTKFSGSLSL